MEKNNNGQMMSNLGLKTRSYLCHSLVTKVLGGHENNLCGVSSSNKGSNLKRCDSVHLVACCRTRNQTTIVGGAACSRRAKFGEFTERCDRMERGRCVL